MPKLKCEQKFNKFSVCLRDDDYARMKILIEHLGCYGPSEVVRAAVREFYATVIPSSLITQGSSV